MAAKTKGAGKATADETRDAKRRMGRLTNVERYKILLHSGVDDKTLRRWERGDSVKPVTARRITASMSHFGIELLRT